MVEYDRLGDVFAALGNECRLRILDRLRTGEATVTSLAEPIQMSLNGVSKHLKVLEEAGLVSRTVSGREHRIRLRPEAIESVHQWTERYERFWTERLDAMEQLIAKRKTPRRTQ